MEWRIEVSFSHPLVCSIHEHNTKVLRKCGLTMWLSVLVRCTPVCFVLETHSVRMLGIESSWARACVRVGD